MPIRCGICHREGHNRRTCPDRVQLALPEIQPVQPVHVQPVHVQPVHVQPVHVQPVHVQPHLGDIRFDGEAISSMVRELDLQKVEISLSNLRDHAVYVYRVVGNMMLWDLDSYTTRVTFVVTIPSNNMVQLDPTTGDRFIVFKKPTDSLDRVHRNYTPWETLVPRDRIPSGTPRPPNAPLRVLNGEDDVINIYQGMDTNLRLDAGLELSEINKWKFNALKLDYLLKEVIRLGGMNHENISPILDLHQDIALDECGEFDKEQAGVPSALTNVI